MAKSLGSFLNLVSVAFVALIAIGYFVVINLNGTAKDDGIKFDENGSTIFKHNDSISLAVIDIGAFLNGNETVKEAIANTVDIEMHRIGAIEITNHGLTTQLINDLYNAGKEFFESSMEFKSKYKSGLRLGDSGWEPVGIVNVASPYESGTVPDPVEAVTLWYFEKLMKNQSIEHYCPANVAKLISKYVTQSRQISKVIHGILTKSLNLTQNWFENDMTDNYFSEFRIVYYIDLERNDDDNFDDSIRLGKHADWSSLTFLRVGTILGFQLQLDRFDSNFYTVNIDTNNQMSKDNIIINLGEMYEMYTNGYYIAPIHRVSRLNDTARLSILHFLGPHMDAMIDVLKDCEKCKLYPNQSTIEQYKFPVLVRQHMLSRFQQAFNLKGALPYWLN